MARVIGVDVGGTKVATASLEDGTLGEIRTRPTEKESPEALAEAHSEDGRLLAQSVVMFTVGTGVGGGLVLNGRIYRGATSSAAEFGHWILFADATDGAPRPEGFPQPGSIEREASGGALDDLAAARGLGDGRGAVEAAE